ncbi:MAG TPA: B12-binding domain-containing protein [Ilumatobacter sp.]|nr:B12-binding domain-containing protein [Ilumatobacter sp.]
MGDTSGMAPTALWGLMQTSLGAVFGLGTGIIIRHSSAAISTALVWTLVVENLFRGFASPKVSRFLPFTAANGLLEIESITDTPETKLLRLSRAQGAVRGRRLHARRPRHRHGAPLPSGQQRIRHSSNRNGPEPCARVFRVRTQPAPKFRRESVECLSMVALESTGVMRIGELSRRVGVSEHLLRAWESRYGLLTPVRSSGNFRLYSSSDERTVRRMQFHIAHGLAPAEAARLAIAEARRPAEPTDRMFGSGSGGRDQQRLADSLQRALDDFDEGAAQAVLDRLLSDFTLATALREVVLPYLRQLGERWERGEATVAQEHFATNVIRGRLTGLARGWGDGLGPRAIIAGPPAELHDLPLLIFGVVLNRSGWRIDYLGASTPVDELVDFALRTRPALVVLAATATDRFDPIVDELKRLATVAPLAIAGAGATQHIADEIGARLISADPVSAAEHEGHRS